MRQPYRMRRLEREDRVWGYMLLIMKIAIVMVLVGCAVLFVEHEARATSIYKCKNQDTGKTTYQDKPCVQESHEADIEAHDSSGIGYEYRPGAQALIRKFDDSNRRMKEAQWEWAKHTQTYSDRLRLRELRMKEDEILEQSQEYGTGFWGWGLDLPAYQGLRNIQRERDSITKHRWNY